MPRSVVAGDNLSFQRATSPSAPPLLNSEALLVKRSEVTPPSCIWNRPSSPPLRASQTTPEPSLYPAIRRSPAPSNATTSIVPDAAADVITFLLLELTTTTLEPTLPAHRSCELWPEAGPRNGAYRVSVSGGSSTDETKTTSPVLVPPKACTQSPDQLGGVQIESECRTVGPRSLANEVTRTECERVNIATRSGETASRRSASSMVAARP